MVTKAFVNINNLDDRHKVEKNTRKSSSEKVVNSKNSFIKKSYIIHNSKHNESLTENWYVILKLNIVEKRKKDGNTIMVEYF